MSADAGVAEHQAVVEQELASLIERIPSFGVTRLPLTGNVNLAASQALTIDDLRGVPLDTNPPILHEPTVPYRFRNDDRLEPGTEPYVATGIQPFRFEYFNNEIGFGGNFNGQMKAYASAHGFNQISVSNGESEEWSHLPDGTQRTISRGGSWPGIMLREGLPRDAYNQLPALEQLVEIAQRNMRVNAPEGRQQIMIDLEDPAPRLADPELDQGFANTFTATAEAFRLMGWEELGFYVGANARQPFPTEYWELEQASLDDPAVTDIWDRYTRQIIDAADVIFPTVYSYYWDESNVAYALANTDLNMEAMRRLGFDKPVRPYTWMLLTGGGGGWRWWKRQTMRDEDLRAQSAMLLFTGADGFVSWNHSGSVNQNLPIDEIKPLGTVVAGSGFDAVPETDQAGAPRPVERYDALYIREIDADGTVRYQFVETNRQSTNYGVWPNIDLVSELTFEDGVTDTAGANVVTAIGGTVGPGRHENSYILDGDERIDLRVNPTFAIEAESMALDGFVAHENADASGGALISRRTAEAEAPGVATSTFTGPTGTYKLVISYHHENDGDASFAVKRNTRTLASWKTWGVEGQAAGPGTATHRERVIRNVLLTHGDTLRLEGFDDGEAFAAFDQIQIIPTLRFTQDDPFSVSMWVRPAASADGASQVLAGDATGDGAGWHLRLTPDNHLEFLTFDDAGRNRGVSSNELALADVWTHVTATYHQGGNMRLYVDGSDVTAGLKGSSTDRGDFSGTEDISIGSAPGGLNPLQGAVDQVRIYKRKLDAPEAAALFEEGRFAMYVASRDQLAEYVRPKTEGVAAQIEGLALAKPFEYLLKHGQVEIDFDGRQVFASDAPILRRVSLGDYHLVATYDPHAARTGLARTITLNDFDGHEGLSVTLPADSETRMFVISTAEAPVIDDVVHGAEQVGDAIPETAVPFEASFTDTDPTDSHTAMIDWGDGTSSAGVVIENTGSGTVTADHVYQNPGYYTISLNVTDDGGQGRVVTSDAYVQGVFVHDGVLQVVGTAQRDRVRVDQGKRDHVRVKGAFAKQKFRDSWITAELTGLEIYLGEGDDVATAAGNVFMPLSVHGGAGDDRIRGGKGDDLIFGGPGSDVLKGRDGNDRIDGGDGDDNVLGGRGDDLLTGSAGDDRIRGSRGRDVLVGAGGADLIDGGANEDLLSAGGAAGLAAWEAFATRWHLEDDFTQRVDLGRQIIPAAGPSAKQSDGEINRLRGGRNADWIWMDGDRDILRDARRRASAEDTDLISILTGP
jgi:hypothetical protein